MIPCVLWDKLSSVYFLAELVIGHSGGQVLKPRHKDSVLALTSRPLVAAWIRAAWVWERCA